MLVHEKRFFATVIDVGIVLILSLLLNLLLPSNIFINGIMFNIIYFVVGFTYMLLCFLISKDRTIGAYSMSLRFLNRDWSKPTTRTILLRSLLNGVLVFHLINIFYILLNKTTVTFFDELSDSFIATTGDIYNLDNKNKELQDL